MTPRWLFVSILLSAAYPLQAGAQDPPTADEQTRVTLARQLFSVSGAEQSTLRLITVMEAQLTSTFQGLPTGGLDSLAARMRRALPALQDSIATLYAARFTAAELQGLLEFLRSPLGQRFVQEQAAIMEESAAMGRRWSEALISGSVRLRTSTAPPRP